MASTFDRMGNKVSARDKLRPLDLSNALKHAFVTGFDRAQELAKVPGAYEALNLWPEYEPEQGALARVNEALYGDTPHTPETFVAVPLEPSPAMRDILSGKAGRAYAAMVRHHPGLPTDPHPFVLQAIQDAFMEAYRGMMASNLEIQNGNWER
jgi:hypothetical protein